MAINITNAVQVQAAGMEGSGDTKTAETQSADAQGLFAVLMAALTGNSPVPAGTGVAPVVPAANGEQTESTPATIEAGSGQGSPVLGSTGAGATVQSATSGTGNAVALLSQTKQNGGTVPVSTPVFATVEQPDGIKTDGTAVVAIEQDGAAVSNKPTATGCTVSDSNAVASLSQTEQDVGTVPVSTPVLNTVEQPDGAVPVSTPVLNTIEQPDGAKIDDIAVVAVEPDGADVHSTGVPSQEQNAVPVPKILPAGTTDQPVDGTAGMLVDTQVAETTGSVTDKMPDSVHSATGPPKTAPLDQQQTAPPGPIPSADPTGQIDGKEHSPPPISQPDVAEVNARSTANVTATAVSAQPESVQAVVDSLVSGKDGSDEQSPNNPVPVQVETVATLTSVAVSATPSSQGGNPAGRNSRDTADTAFNSLGLLVKDSSGPSGIGGPTGVAHLVHKTGHSPAPIVDQVVTAVRTLQTENRSEMRIRLNPPNLGEMHVRVIHENNTLRVELTVQTGLTRDLLAARAPELRQALANISGPVSDLHITVAGGADASFASFTASDGSGWTGGHNDQFGRPYTAPARDFVPETCWETPLDGVLEPAWSMQDGHIDVRA